MYSQASLRAVMAFFPAPCDAAKTTKCPTMASGAPNFGAAYAYLSSGQAYGSSSHALVLPGALVGGGDGTKDGTDDADWTDGIIIGVCGAFALIYIIYIVYRRCTGPNNYATAGSGDKQEPLLEGGMDLSGYREFAMDETRTSEAGGVHRTSASGYTQYRLSVGGTESATL